MSNLGTRHLAPVRADHAVTATTPPGLLRIVIVSVEDSQVTIELQGDLDAQTVTVLRSSFTSLLAARRRAVRLDLSQLSFLDCAGLGLLVWAHQQFLDSGGAIVLTGVGNYLARLMAITNLDTRLLIVHEPDASRSRPARHLSCVPDSPSGSTPSGVDARAGGGPSDSGDPTDHPIAPTSADWTHT